MRLAKGAPASPPAGQAASRRLLVWRRLSSLRLGRAGTGWKACPTRELAFLVLTFTTSPLFAHGGENHHLDPSTVLTWWTWEPQITIPLAITAVLYAIGLARLWRAAGRNHGIRMWEAIAFFLGWLSLIVALVSPLDRLGGILFSAHMAQHEVLMIVAAPLLVLGRPLIAVLWALPASWRTPVAHAAQSRPIAVPWRFITGGLFAVTVHAVAIWVWHLPSLFQATLRSEAVHAAQHISFLGTALLFWWALIHGRYGRSSYGIAVVYVFITAIHTGALGALLTFSPNLLYPIYEKTTAGWGLDPIEDQQLAGLIMWIPAGTILVVLGLALFAAWLSEAERRVALTRSESLRDTEKA